MSAYESISTPGVNHTPECAFVEILLLKEHKSLPQYPWRKISGFQKQWNAKMSLLLKLMRDKQVIPEELLDLILRGRLRPEKFTWANVGLVRWHIDNSWYDRVILTDVIDDMKGEYGATEVAQPVEKPKMKSIKDLTRRKDA